MKVALLQYPIEWANPQANVQQLDQRLHAIKGQADIAVLPEMFSTGFCTNRLDIAEPWGGQTCHALQSMADRYDMAIIGSMIVANDSNQNAEGKELEKYLYNRGFMFRPFGTPLYCNKRHLYKHGGEADFFRAGSSRDIWEYKGVKIRLAVCYDLRFPVWLRQDKENLYDLLICVACWPTIRIQYWDCMLAARAAENQCFVIGVNVVGIDGLNLDYNGHSVAYNTRLEDLAHFADYESGTRIVDLPIEDLRHYREVLPLWKDADEWQLK